MKVYKRRKPVLWESMGCTRPLVELFVRLLAKYYFFLRLVESTKTRDSALSQLIYLLFDDVKCGGFYVL